MIVCGATTVVAESLAPSGGQNTTSENAHIPRAAAYQASSAGLNSYNSSSIHKKNSLCVKMRVLSLACVAVAVTAQDPAQGWLGYAKAVSPTNAGRITYAEATWINGGNPSQGGAFYSPWFGIETSDNLNLFQPVRTSPPPPRLPLQGACLRGPCAFWSRWKCWQSSP